MKAHLLAFATLALASASVFAAHTTPADIAVESGLTTRHVSMVLGSSTGYAEFASTYSTVYAKLHRALGDQRMQQLMVANRITPRASLVARVERPRVERGG